MPALFVFLFKVNIALLLFCAGYYLVLRHLTFYTLNRAYLMVAILFATLYPKIDLSDFAQRHETLTKPVQTVVLNWQTPAETFINPLTQLNYWQWATVVFWAGAIFLAFRLMMQLFSLFQLYRRSQPARILDHDVRLMDGEAAPFSFWRSIYVNPANHSQADLKAILLHEQIHVNGWHTIDILLAELSSIFYWFNPGIWLMKKAVRENIEFITDRKILNKGFDSKTYQYSLVNVSFNTTTPGIVNHFNISTIKKRIIMMNAKRSSRVTLTRYAFVVPAVVVLLLVFTLSKADVAKPITKKIAIAIKPVTAAIKEAAKTAMAISDTLPAKKGKAAAAETIKTDTAKATKTLTFSTVVKVDTDVDTSKHQKVIIRAANKRTLDSLNIVLNGKKVDESVFSTVDPSKIESINIVNSGDSKLNLIDGYTFNNSKDIVFIATKDSDEGKALADKLGKRRQVTNIRINGAQKDPKNLNKSEIETINVLPGLKTDVKNVLITTSGKGPADRLNKITVRGYKTDTANIVTSGTGNIQGTVFEFKPDNMASVITVRSGAGKAAESFSDKVIVIDGKTASEKEMKKLPVYNIDRMSITSDADTVKKYGDKSKNGVIFITTKKGSSK